jgi:uncharacterized damage-inducible protein DinB
VTEIGKDEFHELLRHMEWADALIWKTVLSLDAAREDRRLLALLYHLHTVQWVYLQVWREQPPHVPDPAELPDLGAIFAWARPYYAEAASFAGATDRTNLSQAVTLPWAAEVAKRYGSAAPATLAETLLQIVMHSTYHRGQVAARVRELGGEPPLTDFIAWVWKGRPSPPW